MANEIKKLMHRKCGKGGIHCECCNRWHGRIRHRLNQMVRRITKQNDKKSFDNL